MVNRILAGDPLPGEVGNIEGDIILTFSVDSHTLTLTANKRAHFMGSFDNWASASASQLTADNNSGFEFAW